ncbi:Hypothetical protein R9X50_00344100 [Acrodontium crateriforme]|uniref:Zn(2)-C6 fungal-type domain-containing protein n=1 Tax=Acrodontium crateriforme TaxID=150365 RepID=A0AAQ3M657_9PEZI|nr:Hypothetical protein R9X50_00344100 [Acrodontium crateriforme]
MEIEEQLQQTPDRAQQACAPCRKQKRKCDKQIPGCGLCHRLGRTCEYSDEPRSSIAPSQKDFSALQKEVVELKNLLASGQVYLNGSNRVSSTPSNSSQDSPVREELTPSSMLTPGSLQAPAWTPASTFESLIFLDSALFQYQNRQIQAPHVRVPQPVLAALGNSMDLREMIEHYFNTVHTYFPIVSKIRLYQNLSNPSHEPGADIALLFLAMRLASTAPAEGLPPAQAQLYIDVKSLYAYVEAQNGFTVQMIQALLLISLYEIGHCIYPAAYLSTGNAARLGHAMGLHNRDAPQLLLRCITWTEQEERRRVWWAVVILDCFVNIGNRGKPFATEDPSLVTHLPIDDKCWDRGEMVVAAPLALSASKTQLAAPFARTCQAIHVLGRVLRHLNDHRLPLDYRFDEALQLDRTIRALASIIDAEADKTSNDDPAAMLALLSSLSICYAALIELYDNYSCTERAYPDAPETQLIVQKVSIDGLADISHAVRVIVQKIDVYINEQLDQSTLDRINPLMIAALYNAASNYVFFARESSDPKVTEYATEVKGLLAILERRWRVAGNYLRIVENTEINLTNAIG